MRINISITEKIWSKAKKLAKKRGLIKTKKSARTGLSNIITALVDDEWERKFPPVNSTPRDADTTGIENSALKLGLSGPAEDAQLDAKDTQSSPGERPRVKGRKGLNEG